jgi:heat shock protein HslJ
MNKVPQFILAVMILTLLGACSSEATATPTSSDMPSNQPTDANVPALHKTWGWEKRVNPSTGAEEQIDDPTKYTLTLKADGSYQFQADCNQGSGSYVADGTGAIRLQAGPVTLAECGSGSRYQDVINMMQAVQDYRLEENGAVLVMVWPAGGPEDRYRAQ